MSFRILPAFFLISFLCGSTALSQTRTDTIQQKTFGDIIGLYLKAKTSDKKAFYTEKLIAKAKKEDNIFRISQGYHILTSIYKDQRILQYADSIIDITKFNDTLGYPARAYQIKGDYFYRKNMYQKALDNYLQFSFHAKKGTDKNLIFNSNYYIAVTKRRAGNVKEALEMHRENFLYAKVHKQSLNQISYLNSITALVNLYNEKKDIDSAMYYSLYGFKEASELRQKKYISHFSLSQGVVHHFKSEFSIAIDSIEKQIPYLESINHYRNLEFAYYYTGESYRKLNQPEKANLYFKKVDTIFQKTQSLFPTLRDNYTRLIDYYKEKNDYKNQIIYLDRLIKVDSISSANNEYLKKEILVKYDVPKLKSDREQALRDLKTQESYHRNIVIILSICILLLIIGFSIQYRKRKNYKKRFQEILENKDSKSVQTQNNKDKKINAPNDIVQSILSGLEKFEEEQLFISNDITLNSLAKKLLTNPNYLSKVVNHYKEASFSNYLNNLRIDYTIDQLKTNPIFQKYTIKAISSEVGFNNVQSFSKAFYNSKGINPSYFIKELKKTQN